MVRVSPAEEILDKASRLSRAKGTIIAPTAAPGLTVSHKAIAAPPSTEIFFSFPCAKNATHCPSGEKKGASAPAALGRRAAG